MTSRADRPTCCSSSTTCRQSTKVARGENGGHKLDNFNVVRHFETVRRWNGSPALWTVPLAPLQPPARASPCWLQRADQGAMIGANKLEIAFSG